MDFLSFPKLPRLTRPVLITEKIDGTNSQIAIDEHGAIQAGSRNRWVTIDDDNYGFAAWVHENRDELLKLGVGRHFGEWYGQGIQRTYGLAERRFALFNTVRWQDAAVRPSCCEVVPVLYRGNFCTSYVDLVMDVLRLHGSFSVPGFMKPEGIIIFHTAAHMGFKKTLDKDESPKTLAA